MHIITMKSNIVHNNRIDKEVYEQKYVAERKEITHYENEL